MKNPSEPQAIDVELLRATRPPGQDGYGLVTFRVRVPVYVWTEILTHRRMVRNASSSRAQSTRRHLAMGYYMPPLFFGSGPGMQAGDTLDYAVQQEAADIWEEAWQVGATYARRLSELGVAKEQANRVLPTFKMINGLLTATEDGWQHFLALRDNPNADSAMQILADLVREHLDAVQWATSVWHAPLADAMILGESIGLHAWLTTAAGRVARVSYAPTREHSAESDLLLGIQLLNDGHLSPFEHLANWTMSPFDSALTTKPADVYYERSNAITSKTRRYGWNTYRAYIEHEGSPFKK